MSGRLVPRILFISCWIALAATTPAGANLLVNGSFESGPPVVNAVLLSAGSTAITGWVVTRTNIHYCTSHLWQVSDGVRNIDLDGSTAGGMAQTFSTIVGIEYMVSWDLAGNPAAAPTIKTLRVEAAGQGATFTFNITGRSFTDMGYVGHTWNFIANSTSTTIEFYSLTSPAGWGPVIDNAVVDVVSPVGSNTWGRLKTLYR